MSTSPLDHLAALREQIEYNIKCGTELAESHKYDAQRYAYDATVKYHAQSGEEYRAKERHALHSAFWHDGARQEVESVTYGLFGLQNLLSVYEESLKCVAMAEAPAPSPNYF